MSGGTIVGSGTGITATTNLPSSPGTSGPTVTIVNGTVSFHEYASLLKIYATSAAVIKVNEHLVTVRSGANVYEDYPITHVGFQVISGTVDFVSIALE